MTRAFLITALAFGSLPLATPATRAADNPTPQQIEFFEKNVRPVLATKCFGCHSVRAKKLKAGLMLDSRARMLKGGETKPAIVPGKPDESLLIAAIRYESFEMPPGGKLPKQHVDALVKWIEMGAPWPNEPEPMADTKGPVFDWKQRAKDHWCWQPIRATDPPAVKQVDWPTSAIDRFILAKLEAAQLKPAADADRRTLIRRVYFDLIGLPPSPAEVRAFLDDASPKAYEAAVDRLLKSEHFGERWARHWMDSVRYAETYGHEFDYVIPHAYRYRDYLIRAFNADVPYDQFAREHIAGDLLQQPRLHPTEGYNESIIGTSFWFFGEATHAPTDVKGDEADRVDNQLDVFSKTFLGVSLACARCHDHKFDPIPQSDYYAVSGFLQSSRRQEAMLDPGGKIRETANKLRQLNDEANQISAAIVSRAWLSADEVATYLLAAREAVAKGREAPATKTAGADILFEDFEGASYDGWQIAGAAFGKAPAKGTFARQQPVSGFLGKGLVNTYQGSDGVQGTATSREFTIERDYVNLLVGGGFHKGLTCVNLLVDGKVVQTAEGRGETDREKLSPRSWDVRAFRGKQAKIQIVDQHTAGWGHINVDHIVFSNSATTTANASGPAIPAQEVIDGVAKDRGLDAVLLRNWIAALLDPEIKSPSHPLHAWSQLADGLAAGGKRAIDARSQVTQQLTAADRSAQESRAKLTRIGDFSDGQLTGWFTTGEAFPPVATQRHWNSTDSTLAEPHVAHSGLFSKRLSGVLRSPTFKLTEPSIWIRMKATGVSVRVIIDGYQMEPFNGLLYRGTRLDSRACETNGKYEWKQLSGDLRLHAGQLAYLEFIDHGDGFVAVDEVYVGNDRPTDRPSSLALQVAQGQPQSIAELAKSIGKMWAEAANAVTDADASRLVGFAIKHQLVKREKPVTLNLANLMTTLPNQRAKIEATLPAPLMTFAMTDGTPENEHIFIRGNHASLGDAVERRLLVALAGDKQVHIKQGSGRLELVERMLSPENPLPSRVMMNRVWHHLFGRGIVASVDDFGKMGQSPTHPELLDWLATDFMQHGWSLKRAIKQIVMSRVYRMASTPPPATDRAHEIDPNNTLLYRMPIRRLQAESIRDAMLAVSGRLDRTIYGPSVDVNLTAFMQGRGRPRSGPLDGAGRRSLYLAIRRNFLSPMMLTFDFPIPFSSMGRRSVSNVPAQALILMNDPFVIEQSLLWARRVLAAEKTTDSRISLLFETAFNREPSKRQRDGSKRFLEQQAQTYGAAPDDERVWADLCHTLVNMKQFIYIE
ncbi:MAG: PSD1 and planctomycete cytochrome C domain-containing protein [Planctomycetota bacterium]|nr:PSD1 and planctomycete cytochrome C domain-containing protein [Planctomycetota bacterium]